MESWLVLGPEQTPCECSSGYEIMARSCHHRPFDAGAFSGVFQGWFNYGQTLSHVKALSSVLALVCSNVINWSPSSDCGSARIWGPADQNIVVHVVSGGNKSVCSDLFMYIFSLLLHILSPKYLMWHGEMQRPISVCQSYSGQLDY